MPLLNVYRSSLLFNSIIIRVGSTQQSAASARETEREEEVVGRIGRKKREMSGVVSKVGDWAFKAFTASLGVTTIYLTATFSANVYRGLAWHNAQTADLKTDNEEDQD